MTSRASGWYDDPEDETQLRYWDGILWTERRMPKLKPGLDSSRIGTPSAYPDESPSGAGEAGAPGTQPGQQHAPQQPWSGAPGQQPPAQHGQQPWYPPQGQQPPYAAAPRPTRARFTPEGQRLSGWWRRFFAWIVDGILIFVVSAAVSWPWSREWFSTYRTYVGDTLDAASAGSTNQPPVPDELAQIPLPWAVAIVAVYAVYEISMVTKFGRTIGKMLAGISVRAVGEPRTLTLAEAGQRFLLKGIASILNLVPLLAGLGSIFTLVDGLWPLGDARKQSIHDKVAQSLVVVGPPTATAVTMPPQGYGQQPPAGWR